MTLPLEGVRVIDLSNVLAGPLASYQMAMLGADVIKIEAPGVGDLARKMGGDPQLNRSGMGASFCAANAGKKSITLNLKHPRSKEIFRRLVEKADVVFENFRPGTMKKLGFDYESLTLINPGLIYCAVSGFGQSGPLSQRPTYDQIIQGFCGLMSVTGDAKTAPLRAGFVVCDTMAAITAAFAICAALYRRQKSGTGEMIDVAMLDASLASMASWPISNYYNASQVPLARGNENPTASPSGTYRTRDGLLNIVNNEDKHFERLCEVIGMPELKTDPRFAERNTRIANRDQMRAILERALQARTTAEWERLFDEAGVPAGPIFTLPEILNHPQTASRKLIKHFEQAPGVGHGLHVARVGFQLRSSQPDVDRPPPQLGQDTAAVLGELGFSAQDIETLRAEGAI